MRALFSFLAIFLMNKFIVCDYISAPSNIQQSLKKSKIAPEKITYVIGTRYLTWADAYVTCREIGMELASINSQAEAEALVNYAKTVNATGSPQGSYWLAGNRNGACHSDFVWFTTGEPVVYRNFAPGQPDNHNGTENCLEIYLEGPSPLWTWNDRPCDSVRGYVCQTSTSC